MAFHIDHKLKFLEHWAMGNEKRSNKDTRPFLLFDGIVPGITLIAKEDLCF